MPRPPSHSVSLATIAKKLSISVSTVSRALRNADGIHTETRARVRQAAEVSGYPIPRIQGVGRNMRPHNILALAQCESPIADQNYRAGMNRASVSLNLSILSHHLDADDCESILDPKNQPPALRGGLVEGLILIYRWPDAVARQLAEKWPTVSIVHHYPNAPLDYIGIDDQMGMSSLVEHLAATGCRRIGFFGFCREMSWSCSRFACYVEALTRLSLPYDRRNVVEIGLSDAMSPAAFASSGWWQQVKDCCRKTVDAWICASATTSFTLCRFLLDHKIRMPDDVAVAGYHLGRSVPADLPSITSTVVADEELGAAAMRRILHRLEQRDESYRSILLPARLMQGETTAVPRAA